MLNSQNYMRDESVLNVGETIAAEVDMSVPGMKVYYHRIPGAQTHMPDGAAIKFIGGQFATSNPEIKAFLDKIADKNGTQVYTKQDSTKQVDVQLAALADEASKPSGDALVSVGTGQATPQMMAAVAQGLQGKTAAPSEAEQALAVAELRNQGVAAEVVPALFRK